MKSSSLVKNLKSTIKKKPDYLIAFFVCSVFLLAYLTLSLIKHTHFGTGYDLAIANQVVWEYSKFLSPISSVHAFAFSSVLVDHIEFIYIFLSPLYWLFPDAKTLIILQSILIGVSGIPIYLLARKYKINIYLSLSILISYFMFYGVQNALWSDVHSLVFGAVFLSFFIFFLDTDRKLPTILFFFLAITSKEDIALLTFLISLVYFIRTRNRLPIYLMLGSIIYSFLIFFVYFPHMGGYRFANENGLLSNINLLNFFNTREKINVFFYSFLSFGFLPVLNPLALIPFLGDLAHYFILGNDTVTSAQSIFMHYRVTDALLLTWPLILVIGKYNRLNNKYLSVYLLGFAFLTTYLLHAPLTYLSKSWFWTRPSGVNNINQAISFIPSDAYVATQTNISPHISNRRMIVTMWGERKDFNLVDSPCGKVNCAWFKWAGKPEYIIVDTSPEWDARHLLANRPDFIEGLENMEKAGKIKLIKEFNTSKIYKIIY